MLVTTMSVHTVASYIDWIGRLTYSFLYDNDASWITTESGSSICLTSKKSGLFDGTYRVKSVFTLTNSSEITETFTVYSDEETV